MEPMLARSGPAVAEPLSAQMTRSRGRFALVLLVIWAGWLCQADPRVLFSRATGHSVGDLVARLFPPDLSPEFLKVALHASLTTAATALVATALSIVFALPLGVLASGRLWRIGIIADGNTPAPAWVQALSWGALHGMGAVRSVPDLVWALLFVAGLGLGPLPGTLALAISYTALLGRVYADIFDEADVRPLEALHSLGASRLQVLLFGILPQSRSLLASYTLYSFECCIRSAAVLGFVGAGGLGYEISLSTRLFEFSQVLTLMGCFVLLLVSVDLLSRSIRTRFSSESAAVLVPTHSRRLLRRALFASMAALLVLAALPVAGIRGISAFESDTASNLFRFATSLLRPEWSYGFLREVGVLALQTIGISVLGTAIGAAFGMLLAFPATRLRAQRHESLERGRWRRVQREAVFWAARMTANLLRATPELVWVLFCVVAVGFGPFAGSLALGLHTGGVLGKLFAETMEESPQEQVEALMALGATPLQSMFWALLPQAWPMMRRYILLRWDMNLRAATILGLVGGGGLGQALYNNVQLGDYAKVSTLILAVMALVITSDWLSQPRAPAVIQMVMPRVPRVSEVLG